MENTVTKFRGLGGYEVLGKCRRGGPVTKEENENQSEKKSEQKEKGERRNSDENPRIMKKNDIERQLAMPLFKDSNHEFKAKMQEYLNKSSEHTKKQR